MASRLPVCLDLSARALRSGRGLKTHKTPRAVLGGSAALNEDWRRQSDTRQDLPQRLSFRVACRVALDFSVKGFQVLALGSKDGGPVFLLPSPVFGHAACPRREIGTHPFASQIDLSDPSDVLRMA